MEKSFNVKILKKDKITYDTRRFSVTKPKNYRFISGQATDIAINLNDYTEKKRPFSFTSINESPNLEFIIKIYKERNSVTKKLSELKEGDELIIREPFGSIRYFDRGVFIAGGTGITPFISIFRQLKKENKLKGNTLIFSNKTEKDIILKDELDKMSKEGLKCIYLITEENNPKYYNEYINENFLKNKIKDFSQHFYVCGPVRFVGEIQHILQKLGAKPDRIIVET